VLGELGCLPRPLEPGALAQQLSHWVGFSQAIELAALHSGKVSTPGRGLGLTHGQDTSPLDDLQTLYAHTRAQLERAVLESTLLPAEPEPPAGAPIGAGGRAAAFEPYQRYYLNQQRALEAAVGPLRTKLREALGRGSPTMRQLALLDSVLEKLMAEQESRLLYTLPRLLKARFDQRGQSAAPAPGAAPPDGTWLAGFARDLQAVLLAELELRLQPVLGLLQALQQEPRSNA